MYQSFLLEIDGYRAITINCEQLEYNSNSVRTESNMDLINYNGIEFEDVLVTKHAVLQTIMEASTKLQLRSSTGE